MIHAPVKGREGSPYGNQTHKGGKVYPHFKWNIYATLNGYRLTHILYLAKPTLREVVQLLRKQGYKSIYPQKDNS